MAPNPAVVPGGPDAQAIVESHRRTVATAERLMASLAGLSERQHSLLASVRLSRQCLREVGQAVRAERQGGQALASPAGSVRPWGPRPRSTECRVGHDRHDADVLEIHQRYACSRDPGDLQLLVAEYEPLVHRLAHRFYRHREPLDDLKQVAYEALVRALYRFDPHRGTPFAAFATATISGAVKRHYRDRGWAIRVPRSVHDISQRLRAVSDDLTQSYGRAPTVPELAQVLAVSTEMVVEALAATSTRTPDSLDGPTTEFHVPGGEETDAGFRRVVDHQALGQLLAQLPPDEQRLLQLYFFDQRSQAEIGRLMGVSQMQVSRLLRRVLHGLRSRVAADPDAAWA